MKTNTLMLKLKSVSNTIRDGLYTIQTTVSEYWIDILTYIGLPLIAYIYVDWRLALATFIIAGLIVEIIAITPKRQVADV